MRRCTYLTCRAGSLAQVQAIVSCNGTAHRGCWFPAGMSSFNFRTQPTPSPPYTTISVSATEPRS